MTIKVGDRIPSVKLFEQGADGPQAISSDDIFKGKTVALFGVPGAFTRTCSEKHLPGFVSQAEAIKSKGVDAIVCIAANDPPVMAAWGMAHGTDGKVRMISDGCLEFTQSAGLDVDLSSRGYGVRCKRFSMIVKDGAVTHMHMENGGFGETSAETLLKDL
ncbi:MAG: peroxiredoxin [Hyphomicrobiaceae bacterium]